MSAVLDPIEADDDQRFRLIDGADSPVSAPMPLITDTWPLARLARRLGPMVFVAAFAVLGCAAYIGYRIAFMQSGT